MPESLDGLLVVAVSSRAIFNFEEENKIFESINDSAYMQLQRERLDAPAEPGVAFTLVKKLLAFNNGKQRLVEVVVLSRNDPISGLRVFRSAEHNQLDLQRGVFTRGTEPFRYLEPLQANLFLSVNDADVRAALAAGFPAAKVFPHSVHQTDMNSNEVRIAFDGDAVLFSDEAERVYQRDGLPAFMQNERNNAHIPLSPGPFKPFLEALHRLRSSAIEHQLPVRIRTALVTARSAPAHDRAMRTLMDWGIEVDEAMFLGGLEKGPFLKEFRPDFFFDDQIGHCESAASVGPTGHVAAGVSNQT